jgi:hypothetical protein
VPEYHDPVKLAVLFARTCCWRQRVMLLDVIICKRHSQLLFA